MDTTPTECDKVQFMSFTKEQVGYVGELLRESVKAILRKGTPHTMQSPPSKHAGTCQYRAYTGPMMAASAQ